PQNSRWSAYLRETSQAWALIPPPQSQSELAPAPRASPSKSRQLFSHRSANRSATSNPRQGLSAPESRHAPRAPPSSSTAAPAPAPASAAKAASRKSPWHVRNATLVRRGL